MAIGLSGDHYLDGYEKGCREQLKEIIRPDVFFDCVGKNEVLIQGVECMAPAGCIVAVGNPASDMSFLKDVYWKVLRKQLTIVGTWNSSFTHDVDDDWHYALDRLSAGCIQPAKLISHRFDISEMQKGLELMQKKSEPYAKVMVTVS